MITVDHASHGRLEMSLGAAWFDKEHTELGIPFPPTGERFDLLEDTLEICTRLMTGETVSYDGKVVSLQRRAAAPGAGADPAPADLDRRQRPEAHAAARRALRRRVARLRHAEQPGRGVGAHRRAGRRGRARSRPTSCGPARCRSTTSTPPASTPASGATPASATSSAAGPAPAAPRSRPSPARSCPSSPDGPSDDSAWGSTTDDHPITPVNEEWS